MAKLEISLFGQFQVLLDEAPVTAFESVKVRALLAYLAAEYARAHTRENLATLLWPDWPQQSAMRNLRNALADLRQNIGDRETSTPFLLITRETIHLNREADLRVDVIEFERAISEQGSITDTRHSPISNLPPKINNLKSDVSGSLNRHLPFAISLYRGPFLDGFPATDSSQFEEWVLSKREYFCQQMLKALGWLAEGSLEQGQYDQAESYARKQIELEAWRETAYQQLMRSLSLKGERAQALAQFESLRKALQRELKVEPSEDTVALYQQIREGKLQESRKGAVDKEAILTPSVAKIAQPQEKKPLHNLPAQLTSFIGREQEIAEVSRLVKDHRLVTLTGPGGTGKTRLALQTAAGLVEQFIDGVWLAELAPVSDPELVPTMAARALGLRELPGPQAIVLLQEYLEQRQLLLILDNCEHVIEACIRLADTLLQACQKLSFLVSSRESLGITGEVSYRVPPMTLPEGSQPLPVESLAQYEAIRLFVERAATVSPGFTLTSTNAPPILRICQRLDGIPLAIELATARTKLLQVEEIAQRLDDRFRLLTGGSRAALPRYQTLRASIDWSYGLLSPAERMLLQHLSVFAGGWVLEAAEAVGCGEGIQSCDVLELLGQLVDKSLIQTISSADGLSRFRMLETIRQYAHEKLVEAGQAEAVRYRHLQYYLELAERVGGKIRGPDIACILERLEAELDNLRLALAWSLEGRGRPGWDPEPGLRLAAALKWFWHCRGRQDEGIHWLELLLAGEAEERETRSLTPERIRCRARALEVAAWSAGMIVEPTKASMFATESQKLYRLLGAEGRVGYAYALLAGCDTRLNPAEANRLIDECQVIFQEAGDRFGLGECIMFRGHIAHNDKDYNKAKTYYEESLALRKEIGDLDGIAGSFTLLARVAYHQGKIKQARSLVEQSLGQFSEIHNDSYIGLQYISLGIYDTMEGNYTRAAAHASKALSIGHRQGDVNIIRQGLLNLGELGLLQGNTLEAIERFEECLAYFCKTDYKIIIADSLYYLGLLAWTKGELEQASRMYTDALINYRAGGSSYHEARVLCELGKIALARGEINQAQAQFEQAFMLKEPTYIFYWENREPAMLTLEAIATLAAAQGLLERATCLLGATEAWHARFYHGRTPRERQERDACMSALRIAMGEQAFTTAWKEGQDMTEEQAIQVAKQAIDSERLIP